MIFFAVHETQQAFVTTNMSQQIKAPLKYMWVDCVAMTSLR